MMNKCGAQCMCDIDFSDDNGYKYTLDELKAIRAHIDKVIKIIESRIKKDAVIDKQSAKKYFDIVNFIYSLSKKMIQTVEETEI